MKTYGHLTSEERAQIEILHKAGEGPTDIGRRIGRAKSTVSVELRRLGAAETYTAKEAMEQAAQRSAVPRRLTVITDALREKIRQLLALGWSPEQIAGRWKSGLSEDMDGMVPLSHETIYAIIAADRKAGGTLWQLLRRRGKKARRDRCGTRRGHRLKVRPEEEIAQRPPEINDRSGPGHWEADLVIGAQQTGVLLVAVERVTLLTRLRCLPSKEAAVVSAALVEMLSGDQVLSLTYDRGLEWAGHAEVGRRLGSRSWFCRPYHSWQKGTVENTNGQVRYYIPKKESFPFEEVEREWIQEVEDALNDRPRRILGYLTPREALVELKA